MRSLRLSIRRLGPLALAAALSAPGAAVAQHGLASNIPKPSEADIARGQGAYALSQLRALAAVLGADPSGAFSRHAMANGWGSAHRGYVSASGQWPARGPALAESLEGNFAMAQAAKMGCAALEGACQAKAAKAARSQARAVMSAKNPGAELSAQVASLK